MSQLSREEMFSTQSVGAYTELDTPVEEFTTPDPITAVESTSIQDLVDLMKKYDVRHIPIVRGKVVVGLLSDRDIRLVAGLTHSQKMLVQARDLMVPSPVCVHSKMSLDVVALIMSQKKIGSVIVNDENGEFFGIFTATDALNALVEIVREHKKIRAK